MKTLLTVIYNLIAEMNPAVKVVIGGFSVFLAVNTYINALWAELFAKLDNVVGASTGGTSDFSPLGMINYVFPLDSVLTFLIALMAMKATCGIVRIIKSFIPTIA